MIKTKDGRRMFSWMNDNIEIKETPKYGKGVFSNKNIKKGEKIIVMGGYIFDIKSENNLNSFNCDKPIEISEEFSFSPTIKSDIDLMPQHYINHSCNPNVGFKGQVFIVAKRDIKKGEEITYDYSMVMCSNPKSNSYFTFKCLCGSKNCRGTVTEDDWKIPELQKKYAGYFQWYLEEKIKKL